METFLHIGPHKTGTTSLQGTLSKFFGADRPTSPQRRTLSKLFGADRPNSSVWYPLPSDTGPGHAALARQIIGGDIGPTRNIIEAARRSGITKLILSSENFSRAYGDPVRLASAFEGERVHLIVTLNSPINRAASMWAEMVKHGHTEPLCESLSEILASPGFRPDLTQVFVEALRPEAVSVITLSRNDGASALFERAAESLGVNLADETPLRTNRRLGLAEAELLLALNRIVDTRFPGTPRTTYVALRDRLMPVFRTEDWRKHVSHIQIETPPAFLDALNERAKETIAALNAINHPNLRIFGKLDFLLEG